jgi:orotate phosphoribosyltransferase
MSISLPLFLPTNALFQAYREELRELLKTHAIRRGRFVLASGQVSDLYLDTRRVSLNARGSFLIGWLLEHWARDLTGQHGTLESADAVGGMALGAAPLVSAVLSQSAMAGRPLSAGFLVRSQVKSHGTQQAIEGPLEPWMRVVMLEDVITSGGSVIKALEITKHQYPSVSVQGILALVNRSGESSLTLQARFGRPFESLFVLADLV